MKEHYRIDRAFENIYELEGGAYVFLATFWVVGASNFDTDAEILEKVEEWENIR